MIIAVDGTSGSGKSTIAKLVAEKLGYDILNTGLLYRKITKECLMGNIPYSDIDQIVKLCGEISFCSISNENLHDEELSKAVPYYSKHEEVRKQVRFIQHIIVTNKNIVVEGRDIGTVVFPDAEIKLYIDAELEERARRRLKQFGKYAEDDLKQVMENLRARDDHDINRESSPLQKHKDAIVIDTTNKTIEQVLAEIMDKIA